MVVRKRLHLEGSGLFFVTTSVNNWFPLFRDCSLCLELLHQFAETCSLKTISVVGYVLMPTHFHALVGLRQIDELAVFMQAFKSLSSRRLEPMLDQIALGHLVSNGQFALWRRGFDDLLIKSEKQFRIKLNYIHDNPVKAGLVVDASDYEYSSAGDWLKGEKGMITIDRDYSWTLAGANQ